MNSTVGAGHVRNGESHALVDTDISALLSSVLTVFPASTVALPQCEKEFLKLSLGTKCSHSLGRQESERPLRASGVD